MTHKPASVPSFNISNSPSDSHPYQFPTKGFLSFLPEAVIPYAELMRLEKPAGYCTFYFPHLYGTLYAALILSRPPPFTDIFRLNLFLVVGSVFLRGAACTWNDVIDSPYDRLVVRCRNRAVARGAVTPIAALIFVAAQSALGAAMLAQLPPLCILYALPLVVLMGFYPFAKRITDYPQIILGFSLAVGQLVGAAAMGIDPLAEVRFPELCAMACLYAANVLCAIIVDAVYSHQDLADDLKLGLRSIAVAWQDLTMPLLWVLALVQVLLLAAAGVLLDLTWTYYSTSVVGTALVWGAMNWNVKLNEPESCGWWFRTSIYSTGLTQAAGLLIAYTARLPV